MLRDKAPIPWRQGNQIELLHNGTEFFPALCAAIDGARSSIHLETYIFSMDRTGERVLGRLGEASARGVRVRVVVDGYGSASAVAELGKRLAAMNVRFRVYRPEPRGLMACFPNRKRLRRMHRKLAVVDNEVAFAGGINVIDDLIDVPDDGEGPKPRFDFAVRLQGPIVADIVQTQAALWLRMASWDRELGKGFYKRVADWTKRHLAREKRAPQPSRQGGMKAALLLRDNVRYRQTIELGYLRAIDAAQREILIANAYFFPGPRLRHALARAAARGVRVRLLLQGRSEYALQYRACRSMYCKLLDQRIEICEYQASYLHAKVAVIDDWAMVGSANLDPFSLLLAREANVLVEDAIFSRELRTALEAEMEHNGRCLTQADLDVRGRFGLWLDDLAYAMLRLGVALTGESAEY